MGDAKQFKIVGRDEEVSVLRRAIDSASGGAGQIVTVVGEAGSGKTRLAVEASEYGIRLGHRVVIGRCREISGAPAYWPWSQILRQVSEISGVPVPAEFTSFAEEPSSRSVTDSNAETRAFLAHESISQYIVEAARETPLLIWIEDVHWADTSSLAALGLFAGDLDGSRVTLLITQRNPEITSDTVHSTLGDISRLPNHRTVDLHPLAEHAVAELVTQRVGQTATSEVVAQILEATGGNALYVTELIRLMADSSFSEVDRPIETLGVPGQVSQILTGRLSSLPEPTVGLLEIAAVLGRTVDLAETAALAGTTRILVAQALEPALTAGIVTATGDGPSRLEFSHELVRSALLERLDVMRSAELNLAAAKLREQVIDEDLAAVAGTLAHHYELASSLVGDAPAIEYMILAGEYALSRLSYPEALTHLEKALEHLLPGAIGEITEIAELSPLEIAESPLSHRKLDDKSERCMRAYARSLAGTDENNRAAIATKISFDYLDQQGRHLEASDIATLPLPCPTAISEAMYRRALEIAPQGTTARVNHLSKLATHVACLPNPDYETAVVFLEQALSEANKLGDSNLTAWCLGRLAMVHLWFASWREGARYAMKAASVAAGIDDLGCMVHAYTWNTVALLTLGDKASASTYADMALGTAVRSRNEMRLSQGRRARALVDFHSGRLRGSIDHGREVGNVGSFGWDPVNEIIAHAHLGLDNEAAQQASSLLRHLQDSGEQRRRYGNVWAAFARVAVDCGLELLSKSESEELFTGDYPPHQLPINEIPWWIGKGYFGLWCEDADLVRQAYERTLPQAGYVPPQMYSFSASADRVLGKFAHYLDQNDTAGAHYEDALLLLRTGDYKFELGWTCYDYGLLLIDQKEFGLADQLITEGLAIADECELVPLIRKLSGVKMTIEGARPNELPFRLTARELDVLELLATGLTNRRIAEKLFVSHNTVGTHVKNIYSKIGCSNRAEATRLATERGLVHESV